MNVVVPAEECCLSNRQEYNPLSVLDRELVCEEPQADGHLVMTGQGGVEDLRDAVLGEGQVGSCRDDLDGTDQTEQRQETESPDREPHVHTVTRTFLINFSEKVGGRVMGGSLPIYQYLLLSSYYFNYRE